ncbi:hypothetical protein [Adhaeribacter pallidiroseus]|uniref:Uncharacterized protein n=1 Tax=Adhaeribacter pallidiroseus TaxID=2072847 RepID=A0A369Q2U0_9BACT|nr:hypothetical protein [Adhaeribacter pallidiroseus]RDC58832.1 hypothetical protein AHMF7616_05266 [Adhaeribacter pallidiroseus]
MSSLIINRLKYKISIEQFILALSVKQPLLFSKNADFLFSKIANNDFENIIFHLKQQLPEVHDNAKSKVYFDFNNSHTPDTYFKKLDIKYLELPFLRRAYIKKN